MMDRKTLQLMFALSTVSWAQEFLMVSQPSSAESTEGGSVTLHCSYLSTSKPTVGSYWWVKDLGLEVKSSTPEFKGRVNRTSDQGFLLERRADIEIRDLRPSDSGTYRCVVKIPGFQETPGKGMKLRVRKRVSQPQHLLVSQPTFALGTAGGSVTLSCSYNSTSEPKVGSYRWVKDSEVEVRNTTEEFVGRVSCTLDQGFLSERRADIEIQNLRLNGSGMYRCMVNIHGLQEIAGNGTELHVMESVPDSGTLKMEDYKVLLWLVLRSLICMAGIVTVALVTCFCPVRRHVASKELNALQRECIHNSN